MSTSIFGNFLFYSLGWPKSHLKSYRRMDLWPVLKCSSKAMLWIHFWEAMMPPIFIYILLVQHREHIDFPLCFMIPHIQHVDFLTRNKLMHSLPSFLSMFYISARGSSQLPQSTFMEIWICTFPSIRNAIGDWARLEWDKECLHL